MQLSTPLHGAAVGMHTGFQNAAFAFHLDAAFQNFGILLKGHMRNGFQLFVGQFFAFAGIVFVVAFNSHDIAPKTGWEKKRVSANQHTKWRCAESGGRLTLTPCGCEILFRFFVMLYKNTFL